MFVITHWSSEGLKCRYGSVKPTLKGFSEKLTSVILLCVFLTACMQEDTVFSLYEEVEHLGLLESHLWYSVIFRWVGNFVVRIYSIEYL